MKRYLKIEGEIAFRTYVDNSWSIYIEILHQDLVSMCMEFGLIEFNLVDSFKIKATGTPVEIIISLSSSIDTTAVNKKGPLCLIELTQNDIGLIEGHLLSFYRDACAPVDHLDIDAVGKNELSSNGTLVIKTPNALAPISGEKARKMLGL